MPDEEYEADGIIPQTSPQRAMARAEVPALFVDTWGFTSWQGHVRFTLGESLGGRAYYRAAFVMDLDNAEEFAVRLYGIVRRRRAKEVSATAESNGGDADSANTLPAESTEAPLGSGKAS